MPEVVLPVLDEAEALPWVLSRMPAGYRPIVVDNGSTDGSAEVAAAHGATVVSEPRRGFGAACWERSPSPAGGPPFAPWAGGAPPAGGRCPPGGWGAAASAGRSRWCCAR